MWTRSGFKGEKNYEENDRVNGLDSWEGFFRPPDGGETHFSDVVLCSSER